MRPFRTIAVTVLILLACAPTEPCACTPALALGTVFGTVTDATGQPVPAVIISAGVLVPDCDGVEYPLVNDAPTVTDGAGKYRYAFRATAPVEGCAMVVALSSDAAVLASVNAPIRLAIRPRLGGRPDSVRVDLRLP